MPELRGGTLSMRIKMERHGLLVRTHPIACDWHLGSQQWPGRVDRARLFRCRREPGASRLVGVPVRAFRPEAVRRVN
jgi:hypothetical protein